MKYQEVIYQFVPCDVLDPSNKHDEEDCKLCMENYDELKGDIISDFESDNPNRKVHDIVEVSQDEPDGRHLKFGIWSVPD